MSPTFRTIATNGINIRAAVLGEGPLVVMVHGFPDSWYSWRHQMAPLAAAGFTACAIDVRGYGGSDKPHAVEAYAIHEIAADIAGVIDALSPGKPAVIMGHDWGAPCVYATALLHPGKVRAVAGLSVPHGGQPPAPLNHLFKLAFTDQGKFFYMVYFQDEGVAEAAFEADTRSGLRKLYFGASADGAGWTTADKKAGEALLDEMPEPQQFSWLSEDDVDYFVGEFEKSGFRGPLNRYRNFERDFVTMGALADCVIRQPSLFVAGEKDLVLGMFGGADGSVARMKENASDLRGAHIVPGVGHWVQQEAPDRTTALLIDWLATLD
jgi:pimeloyl-ACP methyl ester carboxylesterase